MAGLKLLFILVAMVIHVVLSDDGSIVCLESEFLCADDKGSCIHKSWLCDGEIDCPDSSDERYCHTPAMQPSDTPAPNTTNKTVNTTASQAPMTTVTRKKRVQTTSRPPLKVKTIDPSCENLVLSSCDNVNYANIKLPNLFGHSNQYQVKRAMRRWSPILRTGCSSSLNEFLCRVYAPPCQMSRLPCRSMCKRIKKECHKTLKRQKIKWPSTLRCSSLPKKRCFNGATKTTAKPTHRRRRPSKKPTTPQQTTGSTSSLNGCEKITVPVCKDLPYNLTSFPNYFNHRTQDEAGLEVHQFFPLIKVKCSDYLKFFLCSLYVPPCQQVGSMGNILPCRSVCEEARNGCSGLLKRFGFNWPDSMDCSKFPKDNGQVLCMRIPNRKPGTTPMVPPTPISFPTIVVPGIKTPPPPSSASSFKRCEKIKVPVCKDLPYNLTSFPNYLSHRTQAEAGLEVHQFLPIINFQCSDYLKFFLCSLYVPPCQAVGNMSNILPCRSVCENTRNDCSKLMEKFGFSWPDSLACSKFPKDDGQVLCNTMSKIHNRKPQKPECGGTITNPRGTLTSPNYPESYPSETQCKWTIKLPTAYNLIKVTIETMRLEEDRNCFYDYVMIVDKMLNQVGPRHCGTYRQPYVIPVRGNEASIVFVSDKNTSKQGFTLTYKGLMT